MAERPRLDFEAIKRGTTIVRVAQMLNLNLKRDTAGYRCPCPSGAGDARAIKITPGYANKDGTLGAFYCHGCRAHGDLINLWAHVRNTDNYQAASDIAAHFGGGTSRDSSPSPTRQGKPSPGKGMEALDHLEPHHELVELLNVSVAAMDALGAGYASKGKMPGRYLIPLRMPDGTLCGYVGIATKADQAPLLLFPNNLDERCGVGTPIEDEPEPESRPEPDQLRKLFRVVGGN